MKRVVTFVTTLIVMICMVCLPAFAYAKNDRPIGLVTFSVVGSVSSDMSSVTLSAKTPEKDMYYYMGHDLLGIQNVDGVNIVNAKLKFAAVNQYYFRITKASQIMIRGNTNVKYVSAAREDGGYTLIVEVKFPADQDLTPAEELPQRSSIEEGWVQDKGGWCFRLADGSYAKGWKEIDGNWYYFQFDGKMITDQWVDNAYYVGGDGKMLKNTTTPDGYKVGPDGKWIQEANSLEQTKTSGNISMEAILAEFTSTFADGGAHMTDIHIEGDNTIAMTHVISDTFSQPVAMEYLEAVDRQFASNWYLIAAACSKEIGFPVYLKINYVYKGNTLMTKVYG